MSAQSRLLASLLICLAGQSTALAQTGYDSLAKDSEHHGFRTVSVYLNDADEPMGARFAHLRTGFLFDALQIESVPQSFIWVNTIPTSDMGEPHTQEHLLLGKGNVGRGVAGLEQMSMTQSSAFTLQWRTCYHAHTASAPDVYFEVLERQLDALLHPDYTDEEIRREVRNFGVTENADGTLRLEEKGTVYNEMVSSSDNMWSRQFRALGHLLYGTDHPLAYNAGGWPAAIREMKPEHIRRFHHDAYHLANIGMVGAFPKEMKTSEVLERMNTMLTRLQGEEKKRRGDTEADLPAPKMAKPGTIRVVEFPHESEQQPGNVILAWPAVRDLPSSEKLLLELFLSNFAGDPTTNLYKVFIDSQTREMELDARRVFAWTSDDKGQPVYVGLADVATAHLNEASVDEIRARVMAEIEAIATLADDSAELAAFNARLESRVIESRRELSKFVNSPPGFGFRGSGASWMNHLHRLAADRDFRVSVTMKPELAFVEQQLASSKNIWRERLEAWKILGTVPYAVAVRPDPELLAADRAERDARVAVEVERLLGLYEVDDPQQAIRRYQEEYDATSATLEELARQAALPPLVDSPPMTRDDQLDYRVTRRNGVPVVASTFSNMTSATTGIALSGHGVSAGDLLYVSLLPTLLRQVGVIRDGTPVTYDAMSEMLKQEVLELQTYFSTNLETGRCEIAVRGSGNDATEAQRAIEWIELILTHPNWKPENLPRLRDVVDQQLSRLRNRMQAPEEAWVRDPANAFRRQELPCVMATESFLTRSHNAQRLRWLLKDAGPDPDAIEDFLVRLGAASEESSRKELADLLTFLRGEADESAQLVERFAPVRDGYLALSDETRPIVDEAIKDLSAVIVEIPDESLAGDWSYLCRQMRDDLRVPPTRALAKLDEVRGAVVRRPNARMFMVGSSASQKALGKQVGKLLAALPAGSGAGRADASSSGVRPVTARLEARQPEAASPLFVGLVAPNMKGGVFIHSAPSTSYHDPDLDSVLDYLTSRIYGGGGPHSIFMKTWGAGLAYSNGFRGSLSDGITGYYAERTPELPQTLRFVIDYVRDTPRDPGLVDYALAQVFSDFRSASGYERRAEAMAADLTDGLTPDVVRKFREAALATRSREGLIEELYDRMPEVYGMILPGYGVKSKDVKGATYFVVGPPRQLDLYEEYLKIAEGEDARLYRLYPRDFWVTSTE